MNACNGRQRQPSCSSGVGHGPTVTGATLVVSEGGLEPPRPFGHQLLKLARLPIPPLRRGSGSPRIGGQSTGQAAAPRQTPPPRQPPPAAHPLSDFNAVTPRTTSGPGQCPSQSRHRALRKAATDRTCRAIGIPLSHRAAELLVSADETEMPDAYMRCHAGAINQDLKRQPWSALVATLAGKALRRNRG